MKKPISIDIYGWPAPFRLCGAVETPHRLAEVIDHAVKRSGTLWRSASSHDMEERALDDASADEPEAWLDSGCLTSNLIRAAAESGYALDLVGLRNGDSGRQETHLIISQQDLYPHGLKVQLVEGDFETFRGRQEDFIGDRLTEN